MQAAGLELPRTLHDADALPPERLLVLLGGLAAPFFALIGLVAVMIGGTDLITNAPRSITGALLAMSIAFMFGAALLYAYATMSRNASNGGVLAIGFGVVLLAVGGVGGVVGGLLGISGGIAALVRAHAGPRAPP